MHLAFYQLTALGDRAINQDYMASSILDNYAIFVVADGLGGHHAGEKASRFFCHSLLKLADRYVDQLVHNPTQVMSTWIDHAIDTMKALFAGDPNAESAHTTCAILYLDTQITIAAHCGDSRIYRLNSDKLLWRTLDHSIPQQLFNEGKISDAELASHPDQNQLTRSINVQKLHKAEVQTLQPIKQGETFILCSDGFWGNLKTEELSFLAQPDSGKLELNKVARLLALRAQGYSDNLTVQWIRRI
ncbi:MAG: serine/threonine protein phosphatase [Methylobacter sp.]|nr:MAG: serine/threonine protein phosphatase [Methylobacter sp.]PPD24309.1 MAG: serine/threonine protein phosphatase [Methylobacter sp.]PPD35444.1 MAG: serine/threonine protein phosphatase [Methylomonas sp.]